MTRETRKVLGELNIGVRSTGIYDVQGPFASRGVHGCYIIEEVFLTIH